MKTSAKLFICIIVMMIASSCGNNDNLSLRGINNVVNISNNEKVLVFGNSSSSLLDGYLAREDSRAMKLSELKKILAELDKKQNRHAKAFQTTKEYSKALTKILKEIALVPLDQSEEAAPFFVYREGKLQAEWNDFNEEVDSGYFFVVQEDSRHDRDNKEVDTLSDTL